MATVEEEIVEVGDEKDVYNENIPKEEIEIIGFRYRLPVFMKNYWPTIIIIIAPVVFIPVLVLNPDGKDVRCMYIFYVMMVYWVAEPIPLPVTGMIPILMLPGLGISGAQDVCMVFLKEPNMMFIIGILLAVVVENSGLYNRCILKWLLLIGCSHLRLTFGVFTMTAFASMWISSAATTLLTAPILISLLQSLEKEGLCRFSEQTDPGDESGITIPSRTTISYLLGMSYCANIGGAASLLGTGVNLAARGFIEEFFEDEYYIPFHLWIAVFVLPMLVEIVGLWLWFNIFYMGLFWKDGCDPEIKEQLQGGKAKLKEVEGKIRNFLEEQYVALGTITWYEVIVGTLLVVSVVLWTLRDPVTFPGWMEGLQKVSKPVGDNISIKDASAGILIVFLLSVLPARLDFLYYCKAEVRPRSAGPPLLQWKPASKRITWSTVFLIGGGFAILKGIMDSKMLLYYDMSMFKDMHPVALLCFMCFLTIIFAQFTNSIALFFIVTPFFGQMCKTAEIKEFHMLPAVALCCSYSFMSYWTSPPNAFVHEKTNISIKDMVIAGSVPLVLTFVLTILTSMSLGKLLFQY